MPLPHRLHASAQRHGVGLESQVHRLVEDTAGDLEEAGDTDPAQPARPLGGGAPRREALPVRERQRLVQDRLELAAVVDLAVRRAVGHRRGRDEIPPP